MSNNPIDTPSSPESSIGGETAAATAPAPSSPTPQRRLLLDASSNTTNNNPASTVNFDDEEDDDDDAYGIVPATPAVAVAAPAAVADAAEEAPLSPLRWGMEDDDHEANDVAAADTAAPVVEQENDDDDDDEEMEGNGDEVMLAWGTDVNVRLAANTFRDFLRTFSQLTSKERTSNRNNSNSTAGNDDLSSDDDDSISSSQHDGDTDNHVNQMPFYLQKLQGLLHHTGQTSLDVDTMHLYYHNEDCQKLYHKIVHYPMDLVPIMDLVVQRELARLAPEGQALPQVQVRPFDLKQVSNLRCLDPIAMDSLVCLKGMIVRCSPIIPDLKVAHFSCVICGHDHQVSIDRGRIMEPHQCPSCNTKETYQLQHNRSIFADKQLVRLQETPDQVPAGQTPASVVTFCFDDLVDQCQPGDKVEVTGVLRAQPLRVNPKISKLKTIYKTYVDVIHFRTVTGMDQRSTSTPAGEAADGSPTASSWTEERVAKLRSIAARPDIYDQLTQSLAPSIWELDNVKKGVLCMLFGGNHRRIRKESNTARPRSTHDDEDDWSDEDDNEEEVAPSQSEHDEQTSDTKLHKRGDINILLCGDPGTSKSQLLSYVHKLSSRGIYTSGKGSSAVGLTASVVRDPETRDLVLESGALVLSDRGICCIDEFDKMTDATRSILHEAMEQQTVSIAKAGIIASLNARTSILASANPLESRYNPNLSVVDNIKLPPTLLSRFDLIYLILDSPNADQDRKLAQHLVGLYYDTPDVIEPPMDTELLRDYIDYSREFVHPVLSDEATEQLLESYLELRNPPGGNVGNNGTRTISATPRQLESLIRTSEALAKMRYSSIVTKRDAEEAVRLLKVATQAAATDPRTGRIDMDMINTGKTTMGRAVEEGLFEGIKELLTERRGKRLAIRDIAKQLLEITNQTVPQDDIIGAVRRLDADGVVQFNERNQSVFVRTGILGA